MNKDTFRILAINPGSTSTKIAVYENDKLLLQHSAAHSADSLRQYSRSLIDQYPMRLQVIKDYLAGQGFDLSSLNAVVGRGGKIPPCPAGAVAVTQKMVDYLKNRPVLDDHASNLGAILAYAIAMDLSIPSFIYDGVTTDQMDDIARLAGLPDFHRHSGCHALNIRAVARKTAEKYNKSFKELRVVICHLGGGITMGALADGRIIDVIGDEEGAYSPERSGGLPVRQLAAFVMKGELDMTGMARRLRGQGGLVAYLGTNSALEVEKRIAEGDQYAKFIYEGMAYQVAKSLGALSVVLRGRLDCLVLTGSLSYSEMLTGFVRSWVEHIAPVEVFPGENEMEALALGGLRVLRGEEGVSSFSPARKVTLHYDV